MSCQCKKGEPDLADILYEQVQLISDLIKKTGEAGLAGNSCEEILKLTQAQQITIDMYIKV